MRWLKSVGSVGLALLGLLISSGTALAGPTDSGHMSNVNSVNVGVTNNNGPARCTPRKRYTARWGKWMATKPISSKLVSYRPYIKYPKASGHRVYGICRVNAKGLGKRGKEARYKLAPKPVPHKPPTTVIGNPPPDTFPPAPPVAPPAPPTNPPPAPQYSCTGLTVRQPNGSGVMRATVLYTASNGAVFDHATLYPGTGTPGGDQIAITSLNPNFTYTYDGSQNSYLASATVTFRLPNGTMVTTEIDPDAGPGHCSAFVSVPVPRFVCGLIDGLNPVGFTATIGAHYVAANRAQFRSAAFAWGHDGASNTTEASSNSEADFAHIYPGPGDYPLVVTFSYSVPWTQVLQTITCTGTVHIPVPV